MDQKKNPVRKTILIVSAIFLIFILIFRLSTYHPKPIMEEKVYSRLKDGAPERILQKDQSLRLLNWNVQYMAGKSYIFFYDEWDGSGPDNRPRRESIEVTWREVLRIILEENPDVILIQELHKNNVATDKEDQVGRLMEALPEEYAWWCSAWYWKAAFVPHPRIMGSVGMKLAIVSKYKIDTAIRYQLPIMPADPFTKHLNFKRAVLEAVLPVHNGLPLSLMNIHMDAFAQGSDTMEKQVEFVYNLLINKEKAGESFIISGDFNLIPPGLSYSRLPDDEKPMFQKETQIKRLYDAFNGFPTLSDIDGPDWRDYLTHFPNRSNIPDRTLEMIGNSFFS